MSGLAHQPKILDAVIGSDAITVVNFLVIAQRASDVSLHDEAVLPHVRTIGHRENDVTIVDRHTAAPLWMAVESLRLMLARKRAVFTTALQLRRGYPKRGSALQTREFNAGALAYAATLLRAIVVGVFGYLRRLAPERLATNETDTLNGHRESPLVAVPEAVDAALRRFVCPKRACT